MWVIYEYWFARMKNISDNKKKKLREAYGSAKEIYYIEETQLRLQNFLTKGYRTAENGEKAERFRRKIL